MFDANGDGRLSLGELEQIFSQTQLAAQCKLGGGSGGRSSSTSKAAVEPRALARQLMARLDIDGDGTLSLREFSAYLLSDGPSP